MLLVPEPYATEVDGLRRALGDGALGRIPAHLTLVPPVNVALERLEDAREVLAEAAAAVPADDGGLELVLGPPATFWPVTPVVYLAVSDAEAAPGSLGALHELRGRVFRDPLQRALTYGFVPHVTLVDELAEERIPPALTALAGFRLQVRFRELTLLQEVEGRRWTPVFSAPLGPGRVVGRGGLPVELSVSSALDLVRRRTGAAPGLTVTASRQGAAVGVAECRGDPVVPAAELVELWVAPAERGTGVGSHLLAALLNAAAGELGAREVNCRITGGTLDGFLRHRGFAERGGRLWRVAG